MPSTIEIINADVLKGLAQMASNSVDCVVTSPPYWRLRDYGVDGQIGLETTLDEFIARLTSVFREIRRVLKPSGTCWVNMGDAYATAANARRHAKRLKPKDLMLQPARLALAMQEDGWYLRSEIIWSKTNPMPESVTDRPATAHEKIFLLTKSGRYFWNLPASRETSVTNDFCRPHAPGQVDSRGNGHDRGGGQMRTLKQDGHGRRHADFNERWWQSKQCRKVKIPGGWDTGKGGHGSIHRQGRTAAQYAEAPQNMGRNMRNVWEIATQPCLEAHFATFPLEIPRRAISVGCPEGGVVLDPFGGSGTTAIAAERLGRSAILIELNPDYVVIARKRIANARLKDGRATMADVDDAAIPPTPLEQWIATHA